MKSKWKHSKIPFFGKKEIHRFDLENGLKIFVVTNPVAPVFSYQTWFNVGSRDEEQGKSGLAHLFEHMMFKGTKNHPQGVFDRKMESLGARDLNAFTSTDYTAYVASLPKSALNEVAKLESDRMVGLAITREQFESEREVVHNERKQVMENNPEGKMFEEIQRLAFEKHPYGRPVIGFAQDLDAMTVKDCESFYRENYAPNNAAICVSGGVEPKAVAEVIWKHYGKLEPQKIHERRIPQEDSQKAERVSVLNLPIQVEKAYIGYKAPEGKSSKQVALQALSYVFSAGRSSRLYRELVNSGMCIDQGASVSGMKDPSMFYFSFTCQHGKKAERVLEILDKEIQSIRDKGVAEEELARVKNKLATEVHLGLTTNQAICRFIGQHHWVLGDVSLAIREIEEIQKVGVSDLRDVAQEFLDKKRRTVVVGKPV
jgi:zinc protease